MLTAFLELPSLLRSSAQLFSRGLLLLAVLTCSMPPPARAAQPVATYSIVGYDPETRDLGIAVQSKFFAVGAVVPWAEAGVGAIATQAFANTTFGPRGLELLKNGKSAAETLRELLQDDDGRESRQVGVMDAFGGGAAHTGNECMAWAGHDYGEHFTAQGNILVGKETVEAMGRAFRETRGGLGEKLMRALEEGQAAGGDSRGMQSASLLIVREGAGYAGFNDRYCDLRVDDHERPIEELRRIFDLWKVDALISEGYRLVEQGLFEEAYDAGKKAMRLAPEDPEPPYHLACYLSRGGRADAAIGKLATAIERDARIKARALTDPDLTPLRELPRFQEITAP